MNLPKKNYKIALIGYRLSGGGSDKVMANLSLFFESKGLEVHIIIVLDEVTFPYAGKLINLGILKNKNNGVFNKIRRLKALRDHLENNNFDFIIDFRFRTKIIQELILSRYIYNTKTIFTVHSFLIDHYMPNTSCLTRLMYNCSFATVGLTKEMSSEILRKHDLKNVVTIGNPVHLGEISEKCRKNKSFDFEYIIAIGQFENGIKQFDKLIKSYAKSDLSTMNIHLVILGEGNKKALETISEVENVSQFLHLMGYQNNPYQFLKKAKFLVLSSKNEGMPNVILEALACGIPVVSLACSSGPKEMINHEENGLLVEDQNFEELTIAMNKMILDEELYHTCKSNARQSIAPYLLENIGKQWLDLMQITAE